MIKMIVSDLDGTLLQNGAQALSGEAIGLIKEIGSLGVRFVAASGRQYLNMKRMFAPVWRDMVFVAENGSLIARQDEILDKTVIPRDLAHSLIRELLANDYSDVIASGAYSIYIQPKPGGRPCVEHLLYEMKATLTVVDDLCGLDEDIIKISAMTRGHRAAELGAEFAPKWSSKLNVAVSGKEWLDFTLTNKGEAIDKLRGLFSLSREEIAAFGDNFNDESMFRAVKYSYAMSGAHEEVRRSARHNCDSVETVLRNIIAFLRQ